MAEFPYDIFLSYNSAQKDWTRDLARRLRDSGFNVWFDEWRLRGGESWIDGVERGVRESEYFVFVVSPESIDAQWPNFEQLVAILQDADARFRKVIPVIHTHHPLPLRLQIRQYIDFSDAHDDPLLHEFKLAQLMADLDPSRERPTDFELWRQQVDTEEPDVIPPVGPLPRGSLMSLRPNPHFVGREDELLELHSLLRAGSTTAIGQVAAATGLGGIGKTQLAVEYAHRYGRRYVGGVFWLDMEDSEGIGAQVARCGGAEGMNLPGFDALSLGEQIARVRKEWEGGTLRLLIFDNVGEPEAVDEWRPVTGGCRVLITSRRTDWPTGLGVREVRLDTLPRGKAMELLCRGRPEVLEHDEERAAADAICETLGDLPLALALAGSYLESYKYDVTLTQYLDELREQPVLENPALVDFVKDPSPTRHIQNVAATFDLSYRRLDAEDETDLLGMKLFHVASHFAAASIPRRLLAKAAGLDPDDEEERRRATRGICRLRDIGLIEEVAEGRLLLHRLLGGFARRHPPPGQSEEKAWDAVAVTLADFAAEENKSERPAPLARELAHLRHLVNAADQRSSPAACELHQVLGHYLYLAGSYREARAQLEQALEMVVKVFGAEHPNVATVASNLGMALDATGEHSAARRHLQRVVSAREKALGADHPDVATALGNLGVVLHHNGDLPGALRCARRALRIRESALGPDDPSLVTSLANVGMALKDMGNLQAARQPLERALAISQRTLGPEHPRVALVLNNLGGLLDAIGDLEGAYEHYHCALVILEDSLGPEHPYVGTALNNVGMALKAKGDLDGAREHLERALVICREAYGDDHQLTRRTLHNLRILNDA